MLSCCLGHNDENRFGVASYVLFRDIYLQQMPNVVGIVGAHPNPIVGTIETRRLIKRDVLHDGGTSVFFRAEHKLRRRSCAGLAVRFNDSGIAQRIKDSKFHPGSLSNSPTTGAGLRSPESRRDF